MTARIPALALLLGALGAGCGREAPAPDLSEAERAYLEGDYAAAEARYGAAARCGNPEAAGWWGMALLKLERYLEAERAFAQALRGRLGGAGQAQARVGMADALLAQGRPVEAARAYGELVRDARALSTLDQAAVWYRGGMASLRAGLWDEARERFRRVAASWPASPFAAKARERLEEASERTFAVQLGAFSAPESADRLVQELKAAGIAARRVTLRRGGVLLYAVRSGSFAAYEAARDEADRLRDRGREGVVVP